MCVRVIWELSLEEVTSCVCGCSVLVWNLHYMKLSAYLAYHLKDFAFIQKSSQKGVKTGKPWHHSMHSCVYLVCAVPVCTQNRDVPATFHIDLNFITGFIFYNSEMVNHVLLSYTHLLWQYSYHLMLFNLFELACHCDLLLISARLLFLMGCSIEL